MPFQDRRDAGRELARALDPFRGEDVLVLGLPRGGVPVAYEIAEQLDAPLDILVTRKLGAPSNPEFGIGAVGPGGVLLVDERSVRALDLTEADVEEVATREMREMDRRLERYRGNRPPVELEGRTVIVVDDGLATGGTMRAALQSARAKNPARLVMAVPVGPPDTVQALEDEVDEAVVLETPDNFRAVGVWYDRFDQTSDEEVLDLLNRRWQDTEAEHGG